MEKVLVIAVHPDDETLGCGGTLLKHKHVGDEVHWLILTKADQSITNIQNIIKIQQEYVDKAAKKYNFNSYKHLPFISTKLDAYSTSELINEISQSILSIKPTLIYFHHYSDVHTDHKLSFNAIYSCTKNFRYPFIRKILLFETLSETEFSPAIGNNAFIPNVFNDITPFLEKKLSIMRLYTTELMDEPYPRSLSTIKALARYRGSRIGIKYAEAFMLLFEKSR